MSTAATARKHRRVREYLLEETADGPEFVKSKFVAEEIDPPLSSKEVGTAMGRLADEADDLEVERWSYTNATTWRVERASQ